MMKSPPPDIERARSALSRLSPDCNRDTWVRLAMALKNGFGDAGFEIWDEWSSSSEKYRVSDAKATWKSIKSDGKVTIATLFHEAKQAGWNDDTKYKKPTKAEIDARKAEAEAHAKLAEEEDRIRHRTSAVRAQGIWNEATPCDSHPYLESKGVKSYGLRVGRWERVKKETGEVITVSNNALLVPIVDRDRNLWSLQAIFPNKQSNGRDKDYLAGGAKSGNFHGIGKPQQRDGRPVFVLAEGYATAASVHEATGHMVLVCFDKSGLMPVARSLRKRAPDAWIVIAADNDTHTDGNPGLTAARKVAEEVGCLVAVPPPGDFNDLHLAEGLEAVAAAIEDVLTADPVPKHHVVLVPSLDEYWGVAYALECLAYLESPKPSVFVVPYEDRCIQQVLDRVDAEHPGASMVVLSAPGDDAKVRAAVGKRLGCRIELPPVGVGKWLGWGALYLDGLFDAIDGLVDDDLRDKVDAVLARLAKGATAVEMDQVGERLATHTESVHDCVVPIRDEKRRREQQEENRRLQEADAGAMIPSDLSVDVMIERCIWVADGRHVAYVTDDRSLFLKFDDFRALTVSAKTEVEVQQREKLVKRLYPNANLWQADPRRVDAMSATFHPGSGIITANPIGLRAVNTWRPIMRWPAKVDITPFLQQVEYLFPDPLERGVFLDWLAHIEQKPGELPHYGWLHIAENTGTGRNWMASALARVFRGYVAPNVDLPALLDSPYNGELGGRVLAIVDEVQEGASEGNYRHAERLKSMVNAEMRTVNNKYGMKYVEFNSLRWLVFSNHKNALPLNDHDRRFRVVMHDAPARPPETYERLYALLQDAEFINAVGVFLRERDISRFRPGERPPLSADKLAAIAASKPMSTQAAEEIVACWPADIITYRHAIELLTGDPDKKDYSPGMRRAMEEAGAVSWSRSGVNRIKMNNVPHRLWVLRNRDRWMGESTDVVRREVGRANVDGQHRTAAAILTDAVEQMENLYELPI